MDKRKQNHINIPLYKGTQSSLKANLKINNTFDEDNIENFRTAGVYIKLSNAGLQWDTEFWANEFIGHRCLLIVSSFDYWIEPNKTWLLYGKNRLQFDL